MPLWLKDKLWIASTIQGARWTATATLLFTEHHESHAASAFFPSPFEEAAILTIDGVGEWATASIGTGRATASSCSKEIHFPHSLGLLYSAFTYFTGFRVNSRRVQADGPGALRRAEVRGLILEQLLDLKDDGSFRLNMSYFDYRAGLRMTNDSSPSCSAARAASPRSTDPARDGPGRARSRW